VKRWRGLKSLVADAVEHGSRAIEKVQKETARKPFAILEAIPTISLPAKAVHVIHDALVTTTHIAIRTVNEAVSVSLDVAIDIVEANDRRTPATPSPDAEAASAAAPRVSAEGPP
jgi:hypothetical protein